MSNVIDLSNYKKIKHLDKNIKELTQISTILKKSIQDLTKFDHYSSIRRRLDDLFVLYQDIKLHKNKKIEVLKRLQNEKETVAED
jgi:hypothetical protein